jgi:hypothetical protein
MLFQRFRVVPRTDMNIHMSERRPFSSRSARTACSQIGQMIPEAGVFVAVLRQADSPEPTPGSTRIASGITVVRGKSPDQIKLAQGAYIVFKPP